MGRRYRFKVRAQNVHGWGPYSEEGEVLVATEPSKMSPVIVTENADQTVKLSWSLPIENGGPVSVYTVKIRAKDGVTYYESSFCNGADVSIVASRQCNIPMIAFRQLPFLLEQDDLIVAIAQAGNEIGRSPYSEPSTSTVIVSQSPRKPSSSPLMVLQDIMQIVVSMPAVTGFLTGSSTLLSYNLQYRGETSPPTEWTTLVGEAPDSMLLEYAKNGLITDRMY